jgi:hypothetical protein
MREYFNQLVTAGPRWQELLDHKYRADLVFWSQNAPLTRVLENRPEWEKVYPPPGSRDKQVAIFRRRVAAAPARRQSESLRPLGTAATGSQEQARTDQNPSSPSSRTDLAPPTTFRFAAGNRPGTFFLPPAGGPRLPASRCSAEGLEIESHAEASRATGLERTAKLRAPGPPAVRQLIRAYGAGGWGETGTEDRRLIPDEARPQLAVAASAPR